MRLTAILLAGTGLAFGTPAYAAETVQDQSVPETAADQPEQVAQSANTGAEPANTQDIVVTARKRAENLKDVPIAVTAVSGDEIEKRGLVSVKDVAQLTPSLNVNSDGAGRVFVAIRGVGVTLVQTVQPGVGIFVDGIYQPNTAYLNNPLVDVERVEVLRGPQGTLYGKNTLGGAINVITRQPGNELEVRGGGSYAGPDQAWNVFGSVSGPIIEDRLQVRVAAAHRQQDGFIRNTLLGTDANPLNMDTVNATVRAEPVDDVVLTFNGYRDWVKGGSIPYAHIDGPTDYDRTVQLNATNIQRYKYSGVNGKLQAPLGASTNVTLIGAYDQRDGELRDLDIDFNPVDIARQRVKDKLKTSTVELRFDSKWSSQFSSLFGLFYSHESLRALGTSIAHGAIPLPPPLPPLPVTAVSTTLDRRKGDTYAAFGTLFWKPSDNLEAAFGLRVDHESREASGLSGSTLVFDTIDLTEADDVPLTTVIAPVKIKTTQVQPKFTITRHWNDELMTYGSIARGYRGGGFNSPNAPFRTYKGDSAWTYELGTKYASSDRKFSGSTAVFFSDYKDYIGLNQFVRGLDNNPVTVDLNTGDVESYGVEVEFAYKPVRQWTLSGGGSLIHARIVDFSSLQRATATLVPPDGIILASDRVPFQPDWTFNLNSDYVVPVGNGDLDLNLGLVGKGSRVGASLSETRSPVLSSYILVNGGITYTIGGVEVGAFVNNLFNTKYLESFIEKTTLENVFGPGPLASDLGIIGDRRRYGVRARFRF